MILQEKIQKIIEAGCQAPSDDNKQPWRFEVNNNLISVFNVPDKKVILYSLGVEGSWISHGAMFANMERVAHSLGITLNAQHFFDTNDDLFSKIEVVEDGGVDTNINTDSVFKRVSTRLPFSKTPAPHELISFVSKVGVTVVSAQDKQEIQSLGEFAAINEKVLLTNPALHKDFFQEVIVWDKDKFMSTRKGLWVETLGLLPPQKFMFKLMSNWKVCKFFAKLGMPSMVAKENGKVWGSGSLMCGMLGVMESPESAWNAGYHLQLIWLKAIDLGMQGQILAGVPSLARGVKNGTKNFFSDSEKQELLNAYEGMQKVLKTDKDILLLLRLGFTDKEVITSAKLEPKIQFI